jgi:secreted trypsin-like serine protease
MDDPLQSIEDAAAALSRAVAGDDDILFLQMFEASMNLADRQAGKRRDSLARPRITRTRSMVPPPTQVGSSWAKRLYSDPALVANTITIIPDRRRILGGVRTAEFPDCVAIGNSDRWCCSGTLVARNVVVTAAHCVRGGCAGRVFVGSDVTDLHSGRAVAVKNGVAHPTYDEVSGHNDIAALILDEDLSIEPRRIAPASAIVAAVSVRLAGYGTIDPRATRGYGVRRVVDVPRASDDPKYGVDPGREFVAGAPLLDRDSCAGDSGGPAYVTQAGNWTLAGATSRGVPSADPERVCGDGGIYTTIHVHEAWLRAVAGGHWD